MSSPCLLDLLSEVAATTQASLVFLGDYLESPMPRVRTLLCLVDGQPVENFSFRCDGDPASAVYAHGLVVIPADVRSQYPNALVLRDCSAEGYVARRMNLGNRAGIVALVWSAPSPQAGVSLTVLERFAARFAAPSDNPQIEIERERARYGSFVHEEFFREFVLDNAEAFHFSEFMPPVPLDLPEDALLDRLMHTAHVIESNRAMAHLYAYPEVASYLGATPYDTNGPERAPRMVKHWMQHHYSLRDIESQGVDTDGNIVWVRGTVVGIIDDNKLTYCWAKRSDITAQKRYETAIEHKATHDALTGLPNRHWFQQHIDALIVDHASRQRSFCLGILDLNGFKEINDTLGHAVGDRILEEVSKRLLKGLKRHDAAIARLGGDEFAIILPEMTRRERCEEMAQAVQELLNQPFAIEDMQLSIGGALGFALFPQHSEDADDLMRMADVAMYAAKREGQPYAWYRPELDHHSRRRLSLLSSLGKAIENGELFLMFQPIVDLHHDTLAGFEALSRWRHPHLGLIPPGDFIPFAETSEVIRPLTRWVLSEAIRLGSTWLGSGHPVQMSVNISVRNLLDEQLLPHLAECLKQYGLPSHLLKLEVTESALMTRPAQSMRTLQALRALGVAIAIDDFGTGYSSLAYLARLPVTALKVDQSFVREMLKSKTDEQIVRSIVGLAHQCQLSVVAEGVEDNETLAVLRGMGCDQAQGYLIARPMEQSAVEEWIRTSPLAGIPGRPPAHSLHLEQF